jgi:adenylosuccinate synthase
MESSVGKIYIVGGLHYGDEGKGTTVDFLVKTVGAKAVVRYGGGPQAAHHVVLSNGIWHCFSHYGSGMFDEKCQTILSKYMLIYPQTLVRETEALQSKHIKDPLKRLKIDLDCYVITPYHQLISRVYELLRSNRKGSTGLGVGRTVQDIYGMQTDYFPMSSLLDASQGTCIQIRDILDK